MFVSTANITDREGALRMIGYAGKALSKFIKVLADRSYTGDKFAAGVKKLIGAQVEVSNAMNCIHLRFCRKGGLWNALLLGWRIVVCFGKTASARFVTPFRQLH